MKQFLRGQILFNILLFTGISTGLCTVKVLQLLQYLHLKTNWTLNLSIRSDSADVCEMPSCKKQVMGMSFEK